MSRDQRKSERHRVTFKLIYDDGNTFNAGHVEDVSEGGVFLGTALPLPVGTIVRLTPLDPAGGDLFEVKARVVRSVPYDKTNTEESGMGLEFMDITSDDRKRVVSLVRDLEAEAQSFQGEMDPYLGVRLPSNIPSPADEDS